MSRDDHNQHTGGNFRQRLDAVLWRRNPAQLRAFLVDEGQWQPEAHTDEEAAMWMMIAASPVLADLHAEAGRWLMAHGHEHEAQAILGRRREPSRGASGQGARGSRPARRSGHTGGAPAQRRPHEASRDERGGRRTPPKGS